MYAVEVHRTPKQHMDDSAECWLNIISKVSHYHLRKYSAILHRSRMLWD
jgi:hypothetical protein